MYAVTWGWRVLSWHRTKWRAEDACSLWAIALAGAGDDMSPLVERIEW